MHQLGLHDFLEVVGAAKVDGPALLGLSRIAPTPQALDGILEKVGAHP